MPKRHCPGQDTQFWTPDNIFDKPCIHCGQMIEFFRDDLRRACPHCGEYMVNPENDMKCAAWCKFADECLAQLGISKPD